MKAVIVDSDAIFALYNPNDPLNEQAIKTFKKLLRGNYRLLYPTAVLFEVISLFQRVLPSPRVTEQILELIKQEALEVYVVDKEILKGAAELFKPSDSKKNTLIDCSVAVIAKKIGAEAVFSYDEFYSKQKLKLAKNL